jgi:hypothetical protein
MVRRSTVLLAFLQPLTARPRELRIIAVRSMSVTRRVTAVSGWVIPATASSTSVGAPWASTIAIIGGDFPLGIGAPTFSGKNAFIPTWPIPIAIRRRVCGSGLPIPLRSRAPRKGRAIDRIPLLGGQKGPARTSAEMGPNRDVLQSPRRRASRRTLSSQARTIACRATNGRGIRHPVQPDPSGPDPRGCPAPGRPGRWRSRSVSIHGSIRLSAAPRWLNPARRAASHRPTSHGLECRPPSRWPSAFPAPPSAAGERPGPANARPRPWATRSPITLTLAFSDKDDLL